MSENGNRKNLSAAQRRAIEALLTQPTVADAAREAEVASRTLHRWLKKDEAFQQALHDAEMQALAGISRRLIAVGEKSINVLDAALEGRADSKQIRAASIILQSLLQLRQVVSMEERLAKLEEKLS